MDSKAFNNLTSRLAERLQGRDNNNHSVRILTLLERLERQAGALDKVRAARNPLDTEAAHARKVAKAAKRLQAESKKIHDQISEISVQGFAEIGQLLEAQTGLVQSEYAGELRATFRSMDDKQRTATLNAALANGDSETIAAIGLSPAILSGVTEEAQTRYLDAIRQMKAPDLIQESEDLNEALQTAGAASELAGILFNENYDSEKQSAIDAAEQAAAEAETALAESMAN